MVIACLLLGACVRRLPIPTETPQKSGDTLDYTDLRAGWRVRVVVPILRSGGYIVPMTTQAEGNTISVYAGKDFIGYETDYYAVKSVNNSGEKIVLRGATAVVQGKKSERTAPALQLFNFPPNLRFVRIVYLVRESKSDHDMVLLAAADESTLYKQTVAVMSSGSQTCKSSADQMCVRVPAGIGLVLEKKMRVAGRNQWIPVK
jgi:hypothetical protein